MFLHGSQLTSPGNKRHAIWTAIEYQWAMVERPSSEHLIAVIIGVGFHHIGPTALLGQIQTDRLSENCSPDGGHLGLVTTSEGFAGVVKHETSIVIRFVNGCSSMTCRMLDPTWASIFCITQ